MGSGLRRVNDDGSSVDRFGRGRAALRDVGGSRCSVNRKHPLVSVVVIALMAVLAGAKGPTAIAEWATLKAEFLREVLDLPNGIPRKDVFRRVLMLLKP